DVYAPHTFAAFLAAARSSPWESAWYGSAERTELRPDGEVKVGELPADVLGGRGGVTLRCRVDGMQGCHRRGVLGPWPEEIETAPHADGWFLESLGKCVSIHPLPCSIGRHRHTPASTFTRPGGRARGGRQPGDGRG